MITEDYVSFETAKLLKEKKFNAECRAYYITYKDKSLKLCLASGSANFNNKAPSRTSAPSLGLAMKWLRELYDIEIYPYHSSISRLASWFFTIERFYYTESKQLHLSDDYYLSYEEACEDAIRYCLENLI